MYAGVHKGYLYVTKLNKQSQEFVISRTAISGSNQLAFSPYAIYNLSGKQAELITTCMATIKLMSNKTQL